MARAFRIDMNAANEPAEGDDCSMVRVPWIGQETTT